MIVVATFTGENGSQGYLTGRVYQLYVEASNVRRTDGTGFVPYKSLRSFLRNWTNIRVVNKGGS